jgi:cyclophilin family peptidyl-prolyl cis-trans isomerase
MMRTLTLLLCSTLAAGATAQDLAGFKATLTAKKAVVSADASVDFVLALEITEDTKVPAVLLSGLDLEARLDDAAAEKIQKKGKGGAVPMVAGTRLERTISLPATRLGDLAGAKGMATVAVQWVGMIGASCVVRIAPDRSKIDLDALDLAKTEVVLATDVGEMTLSFRPDKAPNHVMNFLKLSKSGFYDGTRFHRVMQGFMIQGGDPNSKDLGKRQLWGGGNPGYRIDAEFSDIRHVRGVLSMAREGHDVNSAGSQFFIMHADNSGLDNQYTAFGHLKTGADVLDKIATAPARRSPRSGQLEIPVRPVVLEAAIILPVYKQ